MSEFSPRRSPRKPSTAPETPPQWMKPADVMKQRRLRVKQNALESRINRGESPKQTSPAVKRSPVKAKRKNPFSRRIDLTNSPVKKKVKQEMNDESLFQLLGLAKQETKIFDLSSCSGGGGWEGLDTSPNALFHQCCLYWQHPHLPWLQLFPRNLRKSGNKTAPALTAYPEVKDSLHRDWSESLRSLFQLVRTRHCPFFYIVSNDFNGVFRAAGINGSTETNAILSPTTRGLRNLLTKEGICFTMPLKPKTKRISDDFNEDEPEGDDDEQEIDNTKWLVSLGIDEEAFNDLNKSQKLAEISEKSEGQNESLVYVEGAEVHSLFNFLINCRTISAFTGPLSGVPPSLISPVAFTGGTLTSLKARQNTVKVDNENYHSMEIIGPILPQTMMNLCNLLENNRDSFSVTSANIDSTKAFTTAIVKNDPVREDGSPTKVGKSGQAFSIESLKDCGLQEGVLNSFCSELVEPFESVKYSNNLYKCF